MLFSMRNSSLASIKRFFTRSSDRDWDWRENDFINELDEVSDAHCESPRIKKSEERARD